MILIADSGGSKTDWRWIDDDGKIGQANTLGFNPYSHQAEALVQSMREILLPQLTGTVNKIYFYGAGVSSAANSAIVKDVLSGFFANAYIEINWDLLGAARALCGHEPGIACILGTGSNSCYYNGHAIANNTPNLGWILGDEGSGASLGKQLAIDYIRHQMPAELAAQFRARFSLEREEILAQVYQGERPAAFLGGFAKFIFQHLKEPYCYQLVYSGFEDFYKKNVMQYRAYQSMKVHFAGSVAFYFSDLLRQVANDLGITVKNILESPIAGLTLYHQKDLN